MFRRCTYIGNHAGALPFHFGTLNVRGLRSKRRQVQLLHLLRNRKLDIAAIQETKIESDENTEVALSPFLSDYNVCVSHAVGVSAGCMLFVRKHLPCDLLHLFTDREGRLICCDMDISGMSFRFVCVYAPNKLRERECFFLSLEHHFCTDRALVLFGDFNCVCNAQDRTSLKLRHDPSSDALQRLICDYQLVDIGENEKAGCRYTHFQGTSHARLDRIYVSLSALPLIYGYTVHPIFFSDHCLVSASFGSRRYQSRRMCWELWKFNNQLLSRECFLNRVTELIAHASCRKDLPLFAVWELFKQEAKMIAIEESSILAFEKRIITKHCINF